VKNQKKKKLERRKKKTKYDGLIKEELVRRGYLKEAPLIFLFSSRTQSLAALTQLLKLSPPVTILITSGHDSHRFRSQFRGIDLLLGFLMFSFSPFS
jgi:hypothetical protein